MRASRNGLCGAIHQFAKNTFHPKPGIHLVFEFHVAPLGAISGVGGRLVGRRLCGRDRLTVANGSGAAIFDRYSCCPAAKVRSTRSRVSSAAGRGGENPSRGRR